jgi:hypothetical protein
VSYGRGTLWLSPDELAEMFEALQDRAASKPAPGRAPYLLSAILFPTGQPNPLDAGH